MADKRAEKIENKKVARGKKAKPQKMKAVEPSATLATSIEALELIKFVLMTEKSVRAVESQNKLVFIVRRDAKRDQIKKAVEAAFESPVADVKTLIDQAGRKKAFVKFKNPGAAGDIAIKLGII
jgi:large subunit ribosomal protein L23